MKTSLTRARETASACWLKHYCGEQDPASMRFSEAELRGAFEAGMEERLDTAMRSGDDAAWTARVLFNFAQGKGPLTPQDAERAAAVVEFLWNDMGEARRLIDDAASLFRTYGKHHREQAEPLRNRSAPQALEYLDRIRKAERNEAMALRLERWMQGDPTNPAEVMRSIAEQMVDGVTIRGVDHESFDRAAEYLSEPVDVVFGDAPVKADAGLAVDHFEQVGGKMTVEDGGIERYSACEDEIAVPGRGLKAELDYDGVTSRERAEALRRRYNPRGHHPFYDSACRAEPVDHHGPEDCRSRFDNVGHFSGYRPSQAAMDAPAPGVDALRAFVAEDTRTWVEKATDWVRSLIDGPGYRRGGFVKDGLEKARPQIDEAIRNAAKEIADRDLERARNGDVTRPASWKSGNVRPVTEGPLADPAFVNAISDTIAGAAKPSQALSAVLAGSLRLQTGDPRFDPAAPVLINGYLYHPTTKGE